MTLSFVWEEKELRGAEKHQGLQIALHFKHTELKAHQNFLHAASGQNLVNGLSSAIKNHNQTQPTEANGL